MPSPMLMDSVIVFGDSLSDIGRKWTTKAGKAALAFNEMYVSPSGRYSDCRNWTDFMIEEATGGQSLVANTAESTIALSKRHINLGMKSMLDCAHPFQYANYAEGGACGDTPASKAAFLGTLKEQIDWFEADLRTTELQLGNTLFFVWFGANDLYTAGRPPAQMHQVADAVANVQRNRLVEIVRARHGKCRFMFVNLARALTSVRYTKQLAEAETALTTALKIQRAAPTHGRASNLWHAQQALNTAAARNVTSGRFSASARAVKNLQEKVTLIKGFETGVMNYNTHLSLIARGNGDAVAEVGNIISEETLNRLFEGNYHLMAGAIAGRATQVSAAQYDTTAVRPITTIDEVHPTDQMYKIIWAEIYAELKRSNSSFGELTGAQVASTLATLAGPSAAVRGDYNSVMEQIRAGGFKLKPPPPKAV